MIEFSLAIPRSGISGMARDNLRDEFIWRIRPFPLSGDRPPEHSKIRWDLPSPAASGLQAFHLALWVRCF